MSKNVEHINTITVMKLNGTIFLKNA